MDKNKLKEQFLQHLQVFADTLKNHVSTDDNQWTIKGFIDVFENIYTISSDTKIVSKILEIHLFSKFLEFAEKHNYHLVLAEKQNWYPDVSFVSKEDSTIKFAVDLKTTYRIDETPDFCNGFTLGSHGAYFTDRTSTKNIQYPYNEYLGHYCLGIIYSRKELNSLEETRVYKKDEITEIPSVITSFQFFAQEKWKIASDKSGSGNTANIGSITNIQDIIGGAGMFSKLGEDYFDDYWKNYGAITVSKEYPKKNEKGEVTDEYEKRDEKITDIKNFLKYKGKDDKFIEENVVEKQTDASVRKKEKIEHEAKAPVVKETKPQKKKNE